MPSTRFQISFLFQLVSSTYRFRKYWPWIHFKCDPHEYAAPLDSLTPEEIKMKKDLNNLYEGICYKEGFGPFKVNPSMKVSG